MKNNKKISSILSILLIAILLIIGVSYAVFSYQEEGTNQELIVGDIWMKYEETNGLILDAAMPTNIENYTTYKVNPVMATQEINELTRCVSVYTNFGYEFDEGSTAESFCKGTGTAFGAYTIQDDLDDWSSDEEYFLEDGGQELLDEGVVIQDGDTYKVNPVMATQEVIDNELTRCVNLLDNFISFDEGSTAESFCKGTGTSGDMTFQQLTDLTPAQHQHQDFLDAGVIIAQIDNLLYFEFTISGKNTYTKKDMWYEIVLNHGEEHEIRTTRIRDNLLRFSLVEIKDGIETTVINNEKYDDLNNKRIWVNTIDKNTSEEVSITYRLYMWIDENTIIGNNREDYTLEEWEDVYASIKVNVSGDFNKKELAYEEMYDVTNASCFETIETTVYVHNNNMTLEEMSACVSYFENINFYFDEGSKAESFCQGTGTIDGSVFNNVLSKRYFNSNELSELEEKNIIIGTRGLGITDYNSDCGSDVVIPRTINEQKVISIYGSDYQNYFANLSSLVMPEGILEIGSYAFYNSQLLSVKIPSTVISIKVNAFRNNSFTNITIPDSVINLDCNAFDEDVVITKNANLVCYLELL